MRFQTYTDRLEGHVLLRAGETVDILFEVSNSGLWMAHCHMAEHTESGMMFSFNVARRSEAT
jgi:FtsP/CotA-like multicopper oxidase with cupredoxin domain